MGRGSAAISSNTAIADVEFSKDDKETVEPNNDREELELEDANTRKSDARFMTPEGIPSTSTIWRS